MARTLEEVAELYAAAYAARDAEAVGDLYEDDAPLFSREDGDYRVVHGVFRSRVVLADGTQHESEGRQSNVSHRGPDGNWLIILDHSSLL